MKNISAGFTLIEILVSMVLISFSSMFMMKCMITSLNGVKNSNIRFLVSREIEIKKNILISKHFHSPDLREGIRDEISYQVSIKINIKDLLPGLKKLTLTGTLGKFRAVSIFYLSGSIKGGNDEQWIFNN